MGDEVDLSLAGRDLLQLDDGALMHMVRLARDVGPIGQDTREQALRDFLGQFRFGGDMVHQPVGSLGYGLRKRVGAAQVVAVIEPRSNSMKLGAHRDGLADSVVQADQVFWYAPANLGWDLAATVAGSAQKQLGLDVGRTSSQVAEAKQALANLTAASRNVELTTAAYGKESRQAAEAVAKQAAAQREATKAAAAAAAATTRLLADTRAVAVAQDGQMSPSLKRAATNAIRFGENVERITDDLHRMELAAVATARATEDKLAKATARASADLAGLHGSTSKVSTGMIALGTAGGNLLASGAQRAVHGIGEAMSFTLRSAIDMESGMADVAKVVDGLKTPTGAATAEYHAMEESLFKLSQRIAIAPEGFAKLAAAAGQAGIAGSELVGFSEEAAKVAVAFDVTAEEAGSGLVKLRTGLNLSQPEVMGLAGSINVLSNSLAATAPQVLDAVQRVGSIGKATNISGQEIAALSAAMIAAA